jgi:hypothetical protein
MSAMYKSTYQEDRTCAKDVVLKRGDERVKAE